MKYITDVKKGDYVYCKKSCENFIEGTYYKVFGVGGLGGDDDSCLSIYCMLFGEVGLTTYTTRIFEEHFETKTKRRDRIIEDLI